MVNDPAKLAANLSTIASDHLGLQHGSVAMDQFAEYILRALQQARRAAGVRVSKTDLKAFKKLHRHLHQTATALHSLSDTAKALMMEEVGQQPQFKQQDIDTLWQAIEAKGPGQVEVEIDEIGRVVVDGQTDPLREFGPVQAFGFSVTIVEGLSRSSNRILALQETSAKAVPKTDYEAAAIAQICQKFYREYTDRDPPHELHPDREDHPFFRFVTDTLAACANSTSATGALKRLTLLRKQQASSDKPAGDGDILDIPVFIFTTRA